MNVPTSFVKRIVFGQDFNLRGVADVIHFYEQWRSKISANDFHPLIPITGGFSFVAGGSLEAMVIGNDWVNLCSDAGAGTKNAVICLASNFAHDMNMVALALEIGMIGHKASTDTKIRLSRPEYLDLINEVFGKNYANIQSMADKWSVSLNPD